MNRFIRLSLITAALSSWASASVVTMNSQSFIGQLDLVVNEASTSNNTTNLAATFGGSSSTPDLTILGQEARLLLGTLAIDEDIADGDVTPNISTQEHDATYGLSVNVLTVQWGNLNFLVTPGMFDLTGFIPGGSDDNTLDGPEEIRVDLSSLFQVASFNGVAVRFTLVDDNFGTDQVLELNQGSAAETVYLRAEVIGLDQPNPTGEVPEPATMALVGSGLLALSFAARRKAKA
jgi:hypothetical protein